MVLMGSMVRTMPRSGGPLLVAALAALALHLGLAAVLSGVLAASRPQWVSAPSATDGVMQVRVLADAPAPAAAEAHAAVVQAAPHPERPVRTGTAAPSTADAVPAPASAVASARPPQPRSAPDLESLRGLTFSGLPMRLRLSIDASGQVVQVLVLQSSEAPDVEDAVRQVFLATAFVPGRRDGVDVATTKDIELAFGLGQ